MLEIPMTDGFTLRFLSTGTVQILRNTKVVALTPLNELQKIKNWLKGNHDHAG